MGKGILNGNKRSHLILRHDTVQSSSLLYRNLTLYRRSVNLSSRLIRCNSLSITFWWKCHSFLDTNIELFSKNNIEITFNRIFIEFEIDLHTCMQITLYTNQPEVTALDVSGMTGLRWLLLLPDARMLLQWVVSVSQTNHPPNLYSLQRMENTFTNNYQIQGISFQKIHHTRCRGRLFHVIPILIINQ